MTDIQIIPSAGRLLTAEDFLRLADVPPRSNGSQT